MYKNFFAAGLVLALAAHQGTPAFATTNHGSHKAKYMAGRINTARDATSSAAVEPVSSTALDADRAILWQESLHGEAP